MLQRTGSKLPTKFPTLCNFIIIFFIYKKTRPYLLNCTFNIILVKNFARLLFCKMRQDRSLQATYVYLYNVLISTKYTVLIKAKLNNIISLLLQFLPKIRSQQMISSGIKGSGQELLKSPFECGIEPPGSISHGVSQFLGSFLSTWFHVVNQKLTFMILFISPFRF